MPLKRTRPIADITDMHDHHREVTGFLCRWCLLGLGVLGIAAVAWVGTLGAASAWEDVGTLVLSDQVWTAGREVNLSGLLLPGLPVRNDLLLSGPLRGTKHVVCIEGPSVYLTQPKVLCGVNPVVTKGLPYGPLAYVTARTLSLVVPGDCPVILLDARSVLDPYGDPGIARRIRRLQGRGAVLLFHGGDAREFTRDRGRIEAMRLDCPLLWHCAPRGDWPDSPLRLVCAWGLDRRHVTVVTAEPALAERATAAGLTVEPFAGSAGQPAGRAGARRENPNWTALR